MARVEDADKHVDQLNRLYLSTIETLAMAIDAKDQVTHGHIRRVQAHATSLAQEVGVRDENLLKAIEAAALLHDMGKLAVPEYILNKPGKLTDSGVRKDEAARQRRRGHSFGDRFSLSGRSDRSASPRELGWHWLSRWHQRNRHSDWRTNSLCRRLLRRSDLGPTVSPEHYRMKRHSRS